MNIEILINGYAWHYKYYDKSETYAEAEQSAKDKKPGLWQDNNSIAPWEYRKRGRK